MAHEKQFTPKQAAFAVLEKVGELLKKSELIKSGGGSIGQHSRSKKNGDESSSSVSVMSTGIGLGMSGGLGKGEGFKHADTHAGHDIHVGQEGGKWAHQLFRHGSGFVNGSNSGAVFESKDKAVAGAKAKLNAGMKKTELENDFEQLEVLLKAEMPWKKPEKDADQHAEGAAPKGEIHPKEQEQAPKDGARPQQDPQHNPKEQAEGNNELAGTTPTQVGQDGKNVPGYDEMKGHIKLAKFIGRMDFKRTNKKRIM